MLREETHRIHVFPQTLPTSSVLELGLDAANYSVNHRETPVGVCCLLGWILECRYYIFTVNMLLETSQKYDSGVKKMVVQHATMPNNL